MKKIFSLMIILVMAMLVLTACATRQDVIPAANEAAVEGVTVEATDEPVAEAAEESVGETTEETAR